MKVMTYKGLQGQEWEDKDNCKIKLKIWTGRCNEYCKSHIVYTSRKSGTSM